MSDFNLSIGVILKFEGGWVNNPVDPGGETNWGISMLMVRREGMTPAELGIPDFNPGSMKLMTVDTAKKIYKKFFWDKFQYEKIYNQNVATKIFDVGVNCGPGRSHRMAQKAANQCGQSLKEDGILGPNSFAGINACDPALFLKAMAAEQLAYYTALVMAKPALRIFLNNWTRRSGWVG